MSFTNAFRKKLSVVFKSLVIIIILMLIFDMFDFIS